MTKEKENNMTNEYNFKVGDKVRIKDTPLVNPDYIGCICEIASVTAGAYITFKDCDSKWHPSVLELVEPCDTKTAFLSRLQSLLREFDASFVAHKTDTPVSVYFKGNEAPSASIGKEINKGCGVVVTADNIMNFDKE